MAEATATTDTRQVVEVSRNDLPLSCPDPDTDAAGLHPRVYIPLKESGGQAVCPYCGAEYRLKD